MVGSKGEAQVGSRRANRVSIMDDRDEQLRKLAEELKAAASAGAEKASEAAEHVERYLDDEPGGDGGALVERLSGAVLHLETSHPDLAATVQAVINSLTASGI